MPTQLQVMKTEKIVKIFRESSLIKYEIKKIEVFKAVKKRTQGAILSNRDNMVKSRIELVVRGTQSSLTADV